MFQANKKKSFQKRSLQNIHYNRYKFVHMITNNINNTFIIALTDSNNITIQIKRNN